jgi:hypothetical protein
MGVFFTRAAGGPGPAAGDGGGDGIQPAAAHFSWARFAVAVGLLLAILAACIYAGLQPRVGTPPVNPLDDLYKALLHAFEVLIGAVVGLLTGEAISNRTR